MNRILIFFLIFFSCYNSKMGKVSHDVKPVHIHREHIMYGSGGYLMIPSPFRSNCYGIWYEAEFSSFEFNQNDSLLILNGITINGNSKDKKDSLKNMTICIGQIIENKWSSLLFPYKFSPIYIEKLKNKSTFNIIIPYEKDLYFMVIKDYVFKSNVENNNDEYVHEMIDGVLLYNLDSLVVERDKQTTY